MTNQAVWKGIWPEGLKSLQLNFYLEADEFDFEGFGNALSTKGVKLVTRAGRKVAIMEGQGASEGIISRLRLDSTVDDQGATLLEFELRNGDSILDSLLGNVSKIDIDEVLEAAIGFLKDPAVSPSWTFGSFTLQTTSWRPTFQLPVTMPSLAPSGGVVPEIEGFEFSYRDTSFPVRRASISLRAGDAAFSVTEMVRVHAELGKSFFEKACEVLSQYLLLFAVRSSSSPSSQTP